VKGFLRVLLFSGVGSWFFCVVFDNLGYVICVGHDILLELFQEGRAFGVRSVIPFFSDLFGPPHETWGFFGPILL
jgi:hypothetical protein